MVAAQTKTSADGVEIAYEVYGNDDVTLVMVHGWPGNVEIIPRVYE